MSARELFHRFVPAHFRNPWRLAARLVRTGDPAALFAMGAAVAGIAASPLDLLLSPWEKRACRRVQEPPWPMAFVCGAPRTGTTLVHQTLVRHLPVSCFTNLTGLFPTSPLAATRLFGRFLGPPVQSFSSFYGRTARVSGLNDALHLWDRWLGKDRLCREPRLSPAAAKEMRRFFAAWTAAAGRPLVGKCNALNAAAHQIGAVLPEAIFICMEREPIWHAQSLLAARRMINDDDGQPYGLAAEGEGRSADPVESVVRQVRFHQELAAAQQQRLGGDRFWRVSYEEFCHNPAALVRRVGQALLPAEDLASLPAVIPAHACANRRTIDAAQFERLEAAWQRALAEAG